MGSRDEAAGERHVHDRHGGLMEQMAGKGIRDRMKMMKEMQQNGMLSPGGQLAKPKKGTGRRLTSKDRARREKLRKKERRNGKKPRRR